MTVVWTVSLVLQWAVLAALCVIVFSLVRQLGVITLRLNPSAGLTLSDGPGPGTEIIEEEVELFPHGSLAFGGSRTAPLLTVFLSPDCSMCSKVAGYARAIADTYPTDVLNLLLVITGTPRLSREFLSVHHLERLPVMLKQHFPSKWAPTSTPFGLALTADGTVAARGIPNALEHLEEMIRSATHGVPIADGGRKAYHAWGDALAVDPPALRGNADESTTDAVQVQGPTADADPIPAHPDERRSQ